MAALWGFWPARGCGVSSLWRDRDVLDIISFHPSGEHRCETEQHGGAAIDEPSLPNPVSLRLTTIPGMTSTVRLVLVHWALMALYCAVCPSSLT